MVFPMFLPDIGAGWLLSFHGAARKLRGYGLFVLMHKNSSRSHQLFSFCPVVTKCSLEGREGQSLVCDFKGTLLRSPSFFPYFMLVAFEGGNILRALLLLLSWPLLWALGQHGELSLRIMVFITFCGMKATKMNTVARAVLPKFYLENLNLHAYEVLTRAGRKVVITSIPRVMVEGFLQEYLSVDEVVGTEMQMVWGGTYFSGLISSPCGLVVKHTALKDLFGDTKPDVGLVSSLNPHDHLFISYCKEAYLVNKEEGKSGRSTSAVMPRGRYPKPLVFHDGRLAFLPTPAATLSLFLWLPMGIPLAITRILIGALLPYKMSYIIGFFTGIRLRVNDLTGSENSARNGGRNKGVLYVCNHRTLLDPVMLSTALAKPVTAVTYSLSRMSELLAPMKTVRLVRDRQRDSNTMDRLLREGNLVVCPEGTTCREPYLLRFSPLFAELAEDIVPVAVDTRMSMFYGTTANGFKWLDPLFFLMNPMPEYWVEFLGHVPPEETCAGGRSSSDVANRIQRRLGDRLGFECTTLTRKDKYMMLANNEGVVKNR